MSFDSLALLRPHAGADLSALAEQHVQHDLTPADRDVLQTAASKFGLHAGVGTALGLGAGLFLAFRARAARRRFFEAFRAAEKPTHVQFANGRTGARAATLVEFLRSRSARGRGASGRDAHDAALDRGRHRRVRPLRRGRALPRRRSRGALGRRGRAARGRARPRRERAHRSRVP
jgi:hypothetical protein